MSMHWICVLLACLVPASASLGASLTIKSIGPVDADKSAVIQKALDTCAAKGGGTVKLTAGKYRLDKPLTVPSGVTLAGEWETPHDSQPAVGTVILAYAGKGKENDPPLVSLFPNSAVKGLTFFYPEQRCPEVQPYPWTIQGRGRHGSVVDVTLVNVYKGIDFGSNWNELHYIRNVFGCPLKVGVFINQCSDVGRVENVHFNPGYWPRSEAENIPDWGKLSKYLFENLIAFDIGRSDWEYISNVFAFGPKIGMHFYETEKGPCNGNFLGVGIDWAKTAILVEQCQEPGLLFTNGQFVGGQGAETHIEVAPTNTGVIQFSNCAFWGPSQRIARIAGSGMVSFSQCNFVWWDWASRSIGIGKKGNPAIEANDGDVTIQGCRFGRDFNQITLGPALKTAVISGNTTPGPLKIANQSKGDVQIFGNVSRTKAKAD